VLFDGWLPQINQQSTVSLSVIPHTSLPTNFQILLVYPLQLNILTNSPVIASLNANSSVNNLLLSNLTLSSGLVSLTVSVTNPSAIQSIFITVYIIYSHTQYIETANITNMTLTISGLSVTTNLASSLVMSSTTLTVNTNFSDPVTNGYVTIKVDRGSFNCSSNVQINNVVVNNVTCATNSFIVGCSVSNLTSISIGYVTPLSIQTAVLNVSTSDLTNEPISAGTSSITFTQAVMYFSVVNANLTFGALTTITLT
jgi:hypothetical protein